MTLWDFPKRQDDVSSLAFPSAELFYPKPWGKAFSVHSSYILLNKRAREQPPAPKPNVCSLCSAPKPFVLFFVWVWGFFSVFKIASALCCSLLTRGFHGMPGKGVLHAQGQVA